jgi:predicted alpha-1,2-mannosidase
MDKATLLRVSYTRVVGEFFTTERFWGGPDSIKISFVLDCNRPIKSIDGWNEKGVLPDVEAIAGNAAGMVLNFGQLNAEELLFKMAFSYTSVDNAIANMDAELNHWDFDKVCKETRSVWNEALGRIAVEGGTDAQRIKFYTDLWHVLLGRHKINDVNGYYPDYAGNKYVNKRTSEPMKVRRLPLTADGKPKFNMYGFDGLWLTHWNLNVLWGLAWPEVMDDLSACLVQYADNGKLLPRGACSGGYSFIMSGCPATSLLVSTYMKGIMKKADPLHTFDVIKRNHMPGGMMSYESADDLKFYISHGYCPDNASKTLEWAFQDWGASRMAARLGKHSDARMFEKRSRAWTPLFNAELGLVFPKKRNGEWLHQDALSGNGWVEANSWQATWSLSHELPKLVKMMGGADKFCEKLNFAFEQARDLDFVYAYSGGYVSYANQPGCSNAHIFAYGGKPWLTQYWVRQVKERAYGGITPDKGYGGHDEDEGQMGGVSALMALGLFSVTGTESDTPYYDITSPIFDKITIKLNGDYYEGSTFTITTHNNSAENCYIQRAQLNGMEWNYAQFNHADFTKGGKLELWLGNEPNKSWGKLKYLAPDSDL